MRSSRAQSRITQVLTDGSESAGQSAGIRSFWMAPSTDSAMESTCAVTLKPRFHTLLAERKPVGGRRFHCFGDRSFIGILRQRIDLFPRGSFSRHLGPGLYRCVAGGLVNIAS